MRSCFPCTQKWWWNIMVEISTTFVVKIGHGASQKRLDLTMFEAKLLLKALQEQFKDETPANPLQYPPGVRQQWKPVQFGPITSPQYPQYTVTCSDDVSNTGVPYPKR